MPPPPPSDTNKTEPGSKSEGEDEQPQPPVKRGLGRTPNHLTLRYQHMYGLVLVVQYNKHTVPKQLHFSIIYFYTGFF